MARVGRLAGAILAETAGDHYLIGNPKQPCDWRAAGFEPPGDLDARVRPVVRLVRCSDPVPAAPVPAAPVLDGPAPAASVLAAPVPAAPVLDGPAPAASVPATPVLELEVELEGEALAMLLAERLVIARTGSVSERLWRLVTGQLDELDGELDREPDGKLDGKSELPSAVIPARWLGELPAPVWQIVRDTVLRCT
jgi:hypothetical protein